MTGQNTGQMKIDDLTQRYGITRQTFYNRLDALEMKLELLGRFKVANPEQVALLDELNEHLDGGGSYGDFVPVSSVSKLDSTFDSTVDVTLDAVSEALDIEPVTIKQSLDRVAGLLEKIIDKFPPTDPLHSERVLEEIAQKNWVLPTSKIKELIGVEPRGKLYQRGGWKFTKAGKIGRESGWRVIKIQDAGIEPA